MARHPERHTMAPARAAAYISGTILLAAWFASAAGVSRRQPAAHVEPPPSAGVQLDAAVSDVQTQASRLRARLAAAPAPQTPLRNPFTFAPREAPMRRIAVPAAVTPIPVASDPVLELAGIAERKTAAGLTRTAVVEAPGDQLFMVTEGQELAGRYRVSAIGADAVELTDLVTGATRRLGLR
jgi:hypothetical protein